MHSHMNTDNP